MIEAGSHPMAGSSDKLEVLRQQINDESYMDAAIKRLALVLSNELMYINAASKIRTKKMRRT